MISREVENKLDYEKTRRKAGQLEAIYVRSEPKIQLVFKSGIGACASIHVSNDFGASNTHGKIHMVFKETERCRWGSITFW
jgi:hypothetical protein